MTVSPIQLRQVPRRSAISTSAGKPRSWRTSVRRCSMRASTAAMSSSPVWGPLEEQIEALRAAKVGGW